MVPRQVVLGIGVDPHIAALLGTPNATVLGSDMGCGCGFRNAFWDEEKVIRVDDNHPHYAFYTNWLGGEKAIIIEDMGAAYVGEGDNVNQHQLLQESDRVLLYGCWEGDEDGPSRNG